MDDPEQPDAVETTTLPVEEERFLDGAFGRIVRCMVVLAAVGAPLCLWRFGVRSGASFAVGCLVATFNFFGLRRVIFGLGERAASTQRTQSSGGVVVRFLLRYGLIAVAGYVMVRGSNVSLYALFAGLSLPVAGIVCEAAYELQHALRRRE